MYSLTLPELIGPGTPAAILRAVQTVAERSFFAVVDPCDDRWFNELSGSVSHWLAATVRFEEGPVVGSMTCTLPEELAHNLFNAFCGRDPSDPAPRREHVLDLVGEFANMVCGSWLSRCANGNMFTLSAPVVKAAPQPTGADLLRLFVAVSDQPLAVSVRLIQQPPHDAEVEAEG